MLIFKHNINRDIFFLPVFMAVIVCGNNFYGFPAEQFVAAS